MEDVGMIDVGVEGSGFLLRRRIEGFRFWRRL